jgi:hypothetical protein
LLFCCDLKTFISTFESVLMVTCLLWPYILSFAASLFLTLCNTFPTKTICSKQTDLTITLLVHVRCTLWGVLSIKHNVTSPVSGAGASFQEMVLILLLVCFSRRNKSKRCAVLDRRLCTPVAEIHKTRQHNSSMKTNALSNFSSPHILCRMYVIVIECYNFRHLSQPRPILY